MNKYKTLNVPAQQPVHQSILPEPISKHPIGRSTVLEHDQQHQFLSSLSSQKRMVFIKLPKKPQPYSNSFRSSLYESSLKRLKQQKVTLLKDTLMPRLSPAQRTYQSIEEEAIKRALKQSKEYKRQYKKNSLPVVLKMGNQATPRKLKSNNHSTIDEQSFQRMGSYETLTPGSKKSTFEIDGAVFGYKNLKQKYLQLRQLSLNNKRKSQLLDKPQYRRHQNQADSFQGIDHRFKMEKTIKDHMNRYNKKDFFQTKVNGYKTTIYPPEKAHHKLDQEVRERKKQFQTIRRQEHIQNFIKKKKHGNHIHAPILQHPEESNNAHSLDIIANEDEIGKRRTKGPTVNPEKTEKNLDCSPWQTEAANFDRF